MARGHSSWVRDSHDHPLPARGPGADFATAKYAIFVRDSFPRVLVPIGLPTTRGWPFVQSAKRDGHRLLDFPGTLRELGSLRLGGLRLTYRRLGKGLPRLRREVHRGGGLLQGHEEPRKDGRWMGGNNFLYLNIESRKIKRFVWKII